MRILNMGDIYLCGHTGSKNRGCEAIVRSTVKVLKNVDVDEITAYTFDLEYDKKLLLDKVVTLKCYPKKSNILRAMSLLATILFRNNVWGQRYLYKELFKNINKDDLIINIGGDTYCCSEPNSYYAVNQMAKENGIKTVFWGCSVDERVLTDPKMIEDINSYSYIITRETLTYEILNQCVKDKSKLYLACDPAFQLTPVEVELPRNFTDGNTVGINISPMVLGGQNSEMVMKNVHCMMDYIIKQSNMNVCLIPHVFDFGMRTQDLAVMDNIYAEYKGNDRVSYIDSDISCENLKYVISKCRFFVGARTHATIAAYSTGVPALALSYSIKSVGIAKDLFGNIDDYVIRWQDLTEEDKLKNIFINTLIEKEKEIRERYLLVLPDYSKSLINTVKEVLK